MFSLMSHLRHRYAICVFNHALSMGMPDWDARDTAKRLLVLLKYDKKHHHALPFDDSQLRQIATLIQSPERDASLRTMQFLFHHYIVIFMHSYGITDDDKSALACHYLTSLDINIAPISSDDKLMLGLLTDML